MLSGVYPVRLIVGEWFSRVVFGNIKEGGGTCLNGILTGFAGLSAYSVKRIYDFYSVR